MKIKSSLVACLAAVTAMVCLTAHDDTSQDKAITEQVKSAFSKHLDVGAEVSVMTKDRVVYLKGNTSPSPERGAPDCPGRSPALGTSHLFT